MPAKRDNPLWETLVIVGSFVFLWVWILSSKGAQAQGASLSGLWTIAQLVVAVALLAVFLRRAKRAKDALAEQDPRNRSKSKR